MKLFLPEAPIELYKTGFDTSDYLNRKPFADKLSGLVDRFETPFVVALDGAWGSGKSFFLRRWVGHHQAAREDTTVVVYFDAFEHDYMDDPFVVLVGAVAYRFESKEPKAKKYWDNGKKIVTKLARPVLRIGAAIATASLSEIAAPLIDSGLAKIGDEFDQASDEFWKKEDSRRAAVSEFRAFLSRLTAGDKDMPAKKIVIVIDELDRCRPDYALSMLEIIKHFFSVPNVHFILGVNMSELENIARSRYGEKVDAKNYIRKFVSVRIAMPEGGIQNSPDAGWQVYLDRVAKDMGVPASIFQEIKTQLSFIRSELLSLRTIKSLLTELSVVPQARDPATAKIYTVLICGLFLFNYFRPELRPKALSGRLEFSDVLDLFSLMYDQNPNTPVERARSSLWLVWSYALQAREFQGASDKDKLRIEGAFSQYLGFPSIPSLLKETILFAEVMDD